jgi:hypothetical protein
VTRCFFKDEFCGAEFLLEERGEIWIFLGEIVGWRNEGSSVAGILKN